VGSFSATPANLASMSSRVWPTGRNYRWTLKKETITCTDKKAVVKANESSIAQIATTKKLILNRSPDFPVTYVFSQALQLVDILM